MSKEQTAKIANGLADRLKAARQDAGMTVRGLAEHAGTTHQSIVGYEAGRGGGARLDTVFTLAEVLKVSPSWLAFGQGSPRMRKTASSSDNLVAEHQVPATCWLAPGFDSVRMIKDLSIQLNGMGGYIEQSYLYLDPMSAACWIDLAQQEDYSSLSGQSAPLDLPAQLLSKYPDILRDGLDVIGLGCGDGKCEVRLVRYLLEQSKIPRIRLFLLDISQPLLSIAASHAAECFVSQTNVKIYAIQGNFHNLPQYNNLFQAKSGDPSRRLVCMFGYTFGSLQNEILFLRNSLLGFTKGDFLLFNVKLASARANQPAMIRATDSVFSGKVTGLWKRRQDQWLSGPIQRYSKNVKDIELTAHLDMECCTIPGSYAVELRADVKTCDGQEKQFAMMYIKRYEAERLLNTLKGLGWEAVGSWKYTAERRLLALLQKMT